MRREGKEEKRRGGEKRGERKEFLKRKGKRREKEMKEGRD